jgi:hypothetical protein
MRKLLPIALLGMLGIAAWAADATGKWTAQVPGRGGNTTEQTFTLKAEGTKLTGTLAGGQGGDVQITDGKVNGDDISFVVMRNFNGNDIKLVFKGKVSASEIKFTRSIEGFGDQAPPPTEFVAKKAN